MKRFIRRNKIVWASESGLTAEMSIRIWKRIINECNNSYPSETGGILLGNYNKILKNAHIQESFVSKESFRSKTVFFREAKEASRYLRKIWDHIQKKYFIGEWHSHPDGHCQPSALDDKAMFKIARALKCDCARPILIILTGNPVDGWESGTIWVYTDMAKKILLRKKIH